MRGFANHLRTKQGAIIGAGVVFAITAITFWSWKSSSPSKKHTKPSDERSVKTKKESVAEKQNDMVVRQSQSKKDVEQEMKEKEVSVKKVIGKKTENVNVEKVVTEGIETQCDESSSVKSHTLSAATSSADETEIATPEHEANTATDNVEKAKLDCTKESVQAASIDIATVSARTLVDSATAIVTESHQQESNLSAAVIESSEQHKANNATAIESSANTVTDTESSTPDHINNAEKAASPPANTISTTAVSSTEIIATDIASECAQQEIILSASIAESESQESLLARTDIESNDIFTATTIGSQHQQEYVVIDHPTKNASVKEQNIVTPVIDAAVTASASTTIADKKPSSLNVNAPVFVLKSLQHPKKPAKKFLDSEELIEHQKQHHEPKVKSRCNHWPRCTNNNCKFFHPVKACRAGDDCSFDNKCMFIHPKDRAVNLRDNNKNAADTATTTTTTTAASSSA